MKKIIKLLARVEVVTLSKFGRLFPAFKSLCWSLYFAFIYWQNKSSRFKETKFLLGKEVEKFIWVTNRDDNIGQPNRFWKLMFPAF